MNITIGRYNESPELRELAKEHGAELTSDHWECWIEPEDKSWILFMAPDGTPKFYPERDKDGGVIETEQE